VCVDEVRSRRGRLRGLPVLLPLLWACCGDALRAGLLMPPTRVRGSAPMAAPAGRGGERPFAAEEEET